MRAHQIMTRDVITVTPDTPIAEAADVMLRHHISGLPVLDDTKRLVGILTESDFLHRAEIGTGRKRARCLQFLLGPGREGADFVREHGRKVGEVMTRNPVTLQEDASLDDIVRTMEKNNVKRLPVLKGDALAGIVSRANLLRAVASMAREVPDPTADDDHIRERIARTVSRALWRPIGFQATVRNGIVHLHGIIVDERSRQATIVAAENTAGVKEVHDRLCWVDSYSGFYVEPTKDQRAAS
ncbi:MULTISPECIES: CBS domain-containing protein [Bradyrhizobium]|uniref:BON domain-containing protein n=2 Tax=Bradyrhizobium TaxID=374 RepID=A0ABY0PKM7_9BRAD|nr:MULTISPECIES: CBS domain-containing protein [Bradyrhizobium]SDI30035.1 BON domain-containing protein [Bradyrhizobium ottawaense]SED65947.1 BON domain-containing protein [Bradyrhizobium lablabi]SHL62324.1 BON domain-containing protein [Bradyrhizobium lablabi]